MIYFTLETVIYQSIIGQYLSKTYLEVKNRPLYVVKEIEETNI